MWIRSSVESSTEGMVGGIGSSSRNDGSNAYCSLQ